MEHITDPWSTMDFTVKVFSVALRAEAESSGNGPDDQLSLHHLFRSKVACSSRSQPALPIRPPTAIPRHSMKTHDRNHRPDGQPHNRPERKRPIWKTDLQGFWASPRLAAAMRTTVSRVPSAAGSLTARRASSSSERAARRSGSTTQIAPSRTSAQAPTALSSSMRLQGEEGKKLRGKFVLKMENEISMRIATPVPRPGLVLHRCEKPEQQATRSGFTKTFLIIFSREATRIASRNETLIDFRLEKDRILLRNRSRNRIHS